VARFREIIAAGDNQEADFAAPARGLFLLEVIYPVDYFKNPEIL